MTLLKAYMRYYHCGRREARYWLHQFRWKVKDYNKFLKTENGDKAKQIYLRQYVNSMKK